MFVLRKLTEKEDVEINISLGKSYTLVHSKRNPEEFKRTLDNLFDGNAGDGCYAFISHSGGKSLLLYKNQKNFIMTGDGQTFANVSF